MLFRSYGPTGVITLEENQRRAATAQTSRASTEERPLEGFEAAFAKAVKKGKKKKGRGRKK